MEISVRELRDRTSECLRRVRSGRSLIVTDRGRKVAVISPVTEKRLPEEDALIRLAERGEITLPVARRRKDVAPMRRRGRSVSDTLLEDRD